MEKENKHKTIFITGASSGLGKSLAIEYAKPNITLFLTGRDKNRLLETVVLCEEKGAHVLFNNIDVKNKDELKKWILNCDSLKNIDLVIANAGISAGTSCGIDEKVYDIFETNIFGVLNTIEPIIPNMIKRKNGQIALISSMSSFIGMASCPAYSASKACISSYGEGLRGYLKQYNINISIVCPGFIKTPLTDKNNFYMPFLMNVETASKKIIKGLEKNKGLIVFPKSIYFFLKIVRFLPFSLTNFIISKLPKK